MSQRSALVHLTLSIALAVAASACSEDQTPTPTDSGVVDSGVVPDAGDTPDAGDLPDAGDVPDAGATTAKCADPVEATCVDEQIAELLLFNNVASGVITETEEAGVFTSDVDARGGGLTPSQSFVYARFTDDGLVKVELGDEGAFDSMDWDIAFRRYVIRVNSGVAGPSCTEAARVPNVTDLDLVTTVPENLTYRTEAYFTETCELVPDGSGLPGSAAVALGSFWSYSMCVQMTDNVFVLSLANGRFVKLQVQHYYGEPGAQDTCDSTGSAPMPSGSGLVQIKWAFLP